MRAQPTQNLWASLNRDILVSGHHCACFGAQDFLTQGLTWRLGIGWGVSSSSSSTPAATPPVSPSAPPVAPLTTTTSTSLLTWDSTLLLVNC